MKVLIVGGTGLISTAISRELLERGDELTLFTRGQTAARFPDGARVVHGERNDFAAFEAQMQALGPFDSVIDMICFRPPQAESALRAFAGRTSQYIFCSTVDVYAKPADRYPITESAARRGDNDYASNKILCEDLVMAAHARGDLPVTIIRPAFTYGEGGGVLDTFGWTTRVIDRLRKGKPILVHGDGSSLWVACHVDDAAHAFVTAAGNAATLGKAYHVAGEEWLTWNRYYQELAEAAGAPTPTLVHIPTDLVAKVDAKRAITTVTNFQGNNIFDNSAAKTDLDFHYTIPWREGVARAIHWLDANGRIENSDDDPFEDRLIAAWEALTAQMAATVGAGDQS